MNVASIFASTHPAGHDPGPLSHIWDSAPAWAVGGVVFLVAVAALVAKVEPLAKIAVFLGRPLVRPFKRQSADEQYRVRQRQGFARHVEAQLKALAVKEDWRDDRFAELEAEVEVEGRERIVRWLRHSPSRNVTLRREKSLSKGLARTTDPLVILEGDPGSGKSVALRHMAEQMARQAQKSRNTTSLIPLYVNLKEFRPLRRPVDNAAVRDFVFESLTRTNDRDVEQFLEEEFDRGMREGSWLLLLDSFDEIPDVLSSTESDSAVEEYALAINDFLSGMRTSRAIVASREFRGPMTFTVPRFRIVALTAKQQTDLIHRSGLRPAEQRIVHEGLAVADPELQQMAKNPMFLGLVCEYVRSGRTFPPSSHSAYDSYLEQRLMRDADRIRRRYGVGPDLVRAIAEEAAFCMTDAEGLGLSPSRQELRAALSAAGTVSVALLDKVLDALEYTKLGRAADDPGGSGQPHFTFAHRRFQEYFATRVVLRAPDRVSVRDLLTNGRWRETAVTILQTQPPEASAPLLEEAALLLAPMVDEVTGTPGEPDLAAFGWPPGCLHVLQLLDAGLGRVPDDIPADIRDGAGQLLRAAWERGRRHDRKWAASAALVADRQSAIWLIDRAFASGSVYLGGVAYTEVSRMIDPPRSLYSGVRQTLVNLAVSGQLRTERVAVKAQISRLPNPDPLLRVLRMLTVARKIDFLLAAAIVTADAVMFWPSIFFNAIFLPIALWSFPVMLSDSDGMDNDWFRSYATAIFLRLIPFYANLLFANTWAFRHNMVAGVFTCIVSLYFAVFPVTVRNACLHARAPGVLVLLGGPVLALAGSVRRAVASTFKGFPSLRIFIIGFAGGTLVGCVGGLIGLAYYYRRYWMRPITDATLLLIGAVVALLGMLVIIRGPIPRLLINPLRNWRHDARVIHALRATMPELDSPALLLALSGVKTGHGANNAFGIALGLDLVKFPDLLRVLSDLAAFIEARQSRTYDDSRAGGLGTEVSEWVVAHESQARRVSRAVSSATLDRIARAVEQAELASRSEPQQARNQPGTS